MRYLTFLCLLLFVCPCVRAQMNVFQDRLALMEMRFDMPETGDFRNEKFKENDYLTEDLRLYSRKQKTEIRLSLKPIDKLGIYASMPQLKVATLVANLQRNEEGAVTAVHGFDEEELIAYNADWGRMYTFQPKSSFSDRGQLQLIAIFKEGKGLAYQFLLFDKAPDDLERKHYLLGFEQ